MNEHLVRLQINPEHTVPTLDDNGFVIWDCHAICAYLVDKFDRDDQLYPRDQRLRAKCNQRMFFNASNLSVRLIDIGTPIYFKGSTEIPKDNVELIVTALEILEHFLARDPFLVGTKLTIADICVGVIVPFLAVFTPMSDSKFPNILAWLHRISQIIPFYDEMNARYPLQYRQLIQDHLQRNRQNR